MKLQSLALISLSTAALSAVLSSEKTQHVIGGERHLPFAVDEFKCDLPASWPPGSDGLPSADELFSGEEALHRQIRRHQAIVRVPTVGYDDNGEPGEDPRWNVFFDFHRLLEKLFPAVHARAKLVKVNKLGLVYTLDGSDPSLKPTMLTAHQDVVPVADPSTWTHPPFSGHYDGKWLWGRGASDDKNSLTALLSVLETLLSNSTWSPRRGIILALGFDEESSGERGAGTIATYLEERFGRNSVALIVDEGGGGLELIENEKDGAVLYANPSVLEKGHVDVLYELHVQGGHSSTPFPHTGIGIIAEIVSTLEANPYSPKVVPGSPIHHSYVCKARYSPHDDPEVTKLVGANDLEALTKRLITYDRAIHYQLQTSQAVDIVSGGVKINAMPEKISLGVNYRVAPHDSIDKVKERTVKLLQPIIDKYQLTVKPFGKETVHPNPVYTAEDGVQAQYSVDYNGTLVLTTRQETQVAPISPTSGEVWDLLSGTIQHTFAFEDGTVVPTGGIMNGNTDTRHYLSLTPHIYRWTPTRHAFSENVHTIDERIDMAAHIDAVKFYYNLIRNFDQSDAAKK